MSFQFLKDSAILKPWRLHLYFILLVSLLSPSVLYISFSPFFLSIYCFSFLFSSLFSCLHPFFLLCSFLLFTFRLHLLLPSILSHPFNSTLLWLCFIKNTHKYYTLYLVGHITKCLSHASLLKIKINSYSTLKPNSKNTWKSSRIEMFYKLLLTHFFCQLCREKSRCKSSSDNSWKLLKTHNNTILYIYICTVYICIYIEREI